MTTYSVTLADGRWFEFYSKQRAAAFAAAHPGSVMS